MAVAHTRTTSLFGTNWWAVAALHRVYILLGGLCLCLNEGTRPVMSAGDCSVLYVTHECGLMELPDI